MRVQNGVVIALVTSVEDPDGQGRIQVEFPWLSDRNRSAWAPLAVALAGGRRGMYFLPEVGDEALVAFEHGDFDHPFIIGFVWNGVDLPPDEQIDSSVRRIHTVSGHVMDFDDRDAKQKVTITTQGEQRLELKDNEQGGAVIDLAIGQDGHSIQLHETERTISIASKDGQSIELADMPGKITIKTQVGQTVELSDVPPQISIKAQGNEIKIDATGVTISAPAGVLNITCASANVSATGILNATATGAMNVTASSVLNVTAPLANFSGMLRASIIQATAVVSPAYTPGVGNLFGL
jgi:phage baseplate assembly protein gpV